MIQDFECRFVALLRLLDCLCFGDAILRVGQVAFSGRYCLRCGFELFSLYKFAEVFGGALSTDYKSSEYQKP